MEQKKYKSPIERILKKSYEEMTIKEFIRIKMISSVVFGLLSSFVMFFSDKSSGNLNPFGFYIFVVILCSVGWYFLFWAIYCKIKKINK